MKLLFDPELLSRVPEGREAALRRLLATERQLPRPGRPSMKRFKMQGERLPGAAGPVQGSISSPTSLSAI